MLFPQTCADYRYISTPSFYPTARDHRRLDSLVSLGDASDLSSSGIIDVLLILGCFLEMLLMYVLCCPARRRRLLEMPARLVRARGILMLEGLLLWRYIRFHGHRCQWVYSCGVLMEVG